MDFYGSRMCPLLTANSLSGRGFPRKGHLLHVMKSSLLKVKLFSDQTPCPEVTLQDTNEAVGLPWSSKQHSQIQPPLSPAGRPSPGPAYPRTSTKSLRVSEGSGCLDLENYFSALFLLWANRMCIIKV